MIVAVEDTRNRHSDHHKGPWAVSDLDETNSTCADETAAKRCSCRPFVATCQSRPILSAAKMVVRPWERHKGRWEAVRAAEEGGLGLVVVASDCLEEEVPVAVVLAHSLWEDILLVALAVLAVLGALQDRDSLEAVDRVSEILPEEVHIQEHSHSRHNRLDQVVVLVAEVVAAQDTPCGRISRCESMGGIIGCKRS
jgi:hypothetical protein